jgi:hypothetical protein
MLKPHGTAESIEWVQISVRNMSSTSKQITGIYYSAAGKKKNK